MNFHKLKYFKGFKCIIHINLVTEPQKTNENKVLLNSVECFAFKEHLQISQFWNNLKFTIKLLKFTHTDFLKIFFYRIKKPGYCTSEFY